MSGPLEEELRSLLTGSDGRWTSIVAEGSAWQDRLVMRQAIGARRGRFSGAGGRVAPATPSLAQGVRDQSWRMWRGGPALLRSEFTIGREFVTVIGQGPRWWRSSPTLGTTSGTGAGRPIELLLGPAAVLLAAAALNARVQVDSVAETTVIGRAALRARVSPIDDRPRTRLALRAAGSGADSLQLVVDRERGILLSVVSFFGDTPFQSVEATSVAFDQELDAALFTPTSAAAPRAARRGERLDLAGLAAVASFTVLAPDPPPSSLPPYVTFIGADQSVAGPERAVIVYALDDASSGRGQLRITESTMPLPSGVARSGWQVDGDLEWREDQHRAAARHRVRTRLERTYVELESSSVETAKLLELARRLVVVPRP